MSRCLGCVAWDRAFCTAALGACARVGRRLCAVARVCVCVCVFVQE